MCHAEPNINIQRLTEISKEIGAWAERNFSVHNPPLGILEEIGEASHCALKQQQGIRGFDDPEHFKEHFLDALCDLCIYTLHGVALNKVILQETSAGKENESDEDFLAHLAGVSGAILLGPRGCFESMEWPENIDPPDLNGGDEPYSTILSVADYYARFRGFDLWPELEKVWAKVKSRDWKTDPAGGRIPPAIPAPAAP